MNNIKNAFGTALRQTLDSLSPNKDLDVCIKEERSFRYSPISKRSKETSYELLEIMVAPSCYYNKYKVVWDFTDDICKTDPLMYYRLMEHLSLVEVGGWIDKDHSCTIITKKVFESFTPTMQNFVHLYKLLHKAYGEEIVTNICNCGDGLLDGEEERNLLCVIINTMYNASVDRSMLDSFLLSNKPSALKHLILNSIGILDIKEWFLRWEDIMCMVIKNIYNNTFYQYSISDAYTILIKYSDEDSYKSWKSSCEPTQKEFEVYSAKMLIKSLYLNDDFIKRNPEFIKYFYNM